jgi:tetratricopeptide (TPR) repeat protein
MGESSKATESYNEALEKCEQILSSAPKNYGALYDKARCYALQGNVDSAVENLREAINLSSKCREGARTDSEFDAIRRDKHFQQLIEKVNV